MRTSTTQVFLHAIIMNSNGALSIMVLCSAAAFVRLLLRSEVGIELPRQPGSCVSRIPAVPTTLITVPTLSGSLTLG
ncbi:Sexual differentiation process protein isp4 [Fusarium oxysporum f. sp. albedinis]|nr:Sexual differentiation process protein isp4 [Fusarium oxysporum f. sp. albedinis]